MRFVHAADLHIDSPLVGLARYPGAPADRMRRATRDAFEKVIAVCLEEDARFLVLAGDVFDSGWKDMSSGLYFTSQLQRLRDVGCRVLLVHGNHDVDLTSELALPDHVRAFHKPSTSARARGGKDDAAHSAIFADEGIAFHGVSYPKKECTESLLGHYPAPIADLFNVGILHTNAAGNTAHASYAPCTVADLAARGYGYWALGHVHEHKVLSSAPWIVYAGNTQGRHAREVGAKGCVVVDVDVEERAVREVRFVPTDVLRWAHATIELAQDDDVDELFAKVRHHLRDAAAAAREGEVPRVLAARITLTGAARAHAAVVRKPDAIVQQIRVDAQDLDEVWVEKIELRTAPARSLDELRRGEGLLRDLLEHTAHLRDEEAGADLARLEAVLDPLFKACAEDLARAGLDVRDKDVLRSFLGDLVDDAEALLVERLGGAAPAGAEE